MRYSKYFRHQHALGMSNWHIEWCTKYRYKLFRKDSNKNLCRIALIEAAKKGSVNVLELEVQPDHSRMVAELPLTESPVNAVRKMKSISARILFILLPKLRFRYPKGSLWSRGKFVISVGNITLEKAKEYVRNQETHHAKLDPRNPRPETKWRGRPKVEGLPRGGGQYRGL